MWCSVEPSLGHLGSVQFSSVPIRSVQFMCSAMCSVQVSSDLFSSLQFSSVGSGNFSAKQFPTEWIDWELLKRLVAQAMAAFAYLSTRTKCGAICKQTSQSRVCLQRPVAQGMSYQRCWQNRCFRGLAERLQPIADFVVVLGKLILASFRSLKI